MNYFIEEEIIGTRQWIDGEADAERWERTHSVEEYSNLFWEGENHQAIGEKSADLFYWKPAHERMARYLPESLFIVILRDPVERAWSHYWNEVGKGRERLSFEAALTAEEQRASKSAYARNHLSYLSRGFYDESLLSLFKHVSPSRILITTLERCQLDPEKAVGEIYGFIGVDSSVGLELVGTRHNRNWTMVPKPWARAPLVSFLDRLYTRVTKSVLRRLFDASSRKRKAGKYLQSIFRQPASSLVMASEIRSRLTEIYAPHIETLESLLDRQFSEWRY